MKRKKINAIIGNNQMTYSKILNEISQAKRWTQKAVHILRLFEGTPMHRIFSRVYIQARL